MLTQARRLIAKVSRKHVISIIYGVIHDAIDPRGRLAWGWYDERGSNSSRSSTSRASLVARSILFPWGSPVDFSSPRRRP
jgi:hypothetical protein